MIFVSVYEDSGFSFFFFFFQAEDGIRDVAVTGVQTCALPISQPQIGVVTNVGPVHLELVDSIEGVLRAKAELIDALPPGGTAVVPRDFPVTRADVEVLRVDEPGGEVVDGRTVIEGVSFNFTARHQVQNAATALAVLAALGLPRPASVDVDFSRWRGEEDELPGGGLLINDSYNANPVSMRAALAYLAERAGERRRVAILGDMAELGRTGPAYHREGGEAAAELGGDPLPGGGGPARAHPPRGGSRPRGPARPRPPRPPRAGLAPRAPVRG